MGNGKPVLRRGFSNRKFCIPFAQSETRWVFDVNGKQPLSPTIIPLFGILSPPAEEEECHFCMEKITKEQFLVFRLLCCGHYSHRECFKTWVSLSHKESTVRCATVEQYTHTKTCASSVCKNTPKNSIVWRAVTQKFTQNAQQTSQCYSRS